jgi:hypothetical protein
MVKLEKLHGVGFYDDRICGTSRSDRLMQRYPVSTRVNHVANDDEGSSVSFHGMETQIYRKNRDSWCLVHVHYSALPAERKGGTE